MSANATAPSATPLRDSGHRRLDFTPAATDGADAAETAIALLVGEHAFEQVAAAEVRPQRVGHPDLGIGDLPQQEVADAHLAARANQQVRIGLAGRVEKAREALFVQVLRIETRGHGAAGGVDNLGAAAVVERDVEQHAGVGRGLALGSAQLFEHVRRQRIGPADHLEADVVAQQRRQLEPQVALEQHHQRAHFRRRPLPVLDRKRVEREHLEPEARGGLDDVADGVDAGAMAFDARQVALPGPAAVAVHDDGDVPRQAVHLDLARQGLFGPARGNPLQQLIEAHGVC